MKRVLNLIEDLWSDLEINKVPSRKRALERWSQAAGERISTLCFVEGFTESTVVVRALNPAVAMELRYRSREIIAFLNESAGEELFKILKIVVRPTSHRER
jgi:predicted nucleic acid-binding Zn ribbon protein